MYTTIKTANSTRANQISTQVADSIPLLQKDNFLIKAIYEKCIAELPLVDNHPCARKIALSTSIVASLGANASFFPISLGLPAGPLFAVANFIGFFQLDIWAIRGTIHDILGPKGTHEIILLDRASHGKCFTVAIVAGSLVVALLSQVPVALPALDYDGALKIPAVTLLFLGGILIPIRSLQLSLNKTIRVQNCRLGVVGKKMEALRSIMASAVDQHRDIFRKMGFEDKLALIAHLQQSRGSELISTGTFVSTILNTSFKAPEVQDRPVLRKISKAVGVWIAASLETGLALYTYTKTKENVVDNDYAAGALAGAVVLSGVYLAGQSIINTAEKMALSFLNFVTCKPDKSIADELRPKLTLALKLVGLTVDVGALGATIVIWSDFLKDEPVAKWYFECTLCLAYFLFLSTATLDMVDEVVAESILHNGKLDERQIVQMSERLRQLQNLIENSTLLDLSFFVAKSPQSLKHKLLEKVDLTIQRLDEYINASS